MLCQISGKLWILSRVENPIDQIAFVLTGKVSMTNSWIFKQKLSKKWSRKK